MESMHKAVLIGVSIGIFLFVIVILGGYYVACDRDVKMAKEGYEQVQIMGGMNYVWQKAK